MAAGCKLSSMKTFLRDRKPKATPAASSPSSAPASDPKEAPPKYTPRGSGSKVRILVAVKDEQIDFQTMGADASKSLNDLMHNPKVQAQFGIGPLSQGFDPQHCKRLWQAAGNVLWGMGKFIGKYPAEACDVLHFTPAEQEELAKPTATVLDELAPQWLRENQAVAALVIVAGSVIQNKMREAAVIAARIAKEKAAGTYHDPGPRKAEEQRAAGLRSGRTPVPVDPGANGKATDVPTAASGIGPEISGAAPRM
jgi:hypothetical protein